MQTGKEVANTTYSKVPGSSPSPFSKNSRDPFPGWIPTDSGLDLLLPFGPHVVGAAGLPSRAEPSNRRSPHSVPLQPVNSIGLEKLEKAETQRTNENPRRESSASTPEGGRRTSGAGGSTWAGGRFLAPSAPSGRPGRGDAFWKAEARGSPVRG